MNLIFVLIYFLSTIIPVLLSVAFFTLFERKVLAVIQKRRGPNVAGIFGILQPIADGFKLIFKEPVIPFRANKLLFVFAPLWTFGLSIANWLVVPLYAYGAAIDFSLNIFYFIVISSLSVHGLIFAGWASNSKYAFLGGLRAAAQMISYEVSFVLTILPVLLVCETFNLNIVVQIQQLTGWLIFSLLPGGVLFLISALAETNRTPFDLPEAEGELVAGFNVEYSAFNFALFFLAEYSNIILISSLFIILYMGGWNSIFGLNGIFVFCFKLIILLFFFVWVRATLPRYRFDQLMNLGWKIFLPITTGYLVFVYSIQVLVKNFIICSF
jgi:NADH-quinone oxidoreductase subunit H